MEFGLFNLMSLRDHPGGVPGVLDDTRVMVRLAEEAGFSAAWFAEHHFTNYSLSVSPLMLAAHFAGCTSRIRLGTAVIVLPLYQPMRAAQEIALVDQLSEGRLVLGVGTGYQPFEFERYGADVAARADTFLKYWDVVEAALTGGEIGPEAAALGLPETPVLLHPRQRPLPPLYVTGGDPRILQRLAPRPRYMPVVAPLVLPPPQPLRDFEAAWTARGRITLAPAQAQGPFADSLGGIATLTRARGHEGVADRFRQCRRPISTRQWLPSGGSGRPAQSGGGLDRRSCRGWRSGRRRTVAGHRAIDIPAWRAPPSGMADGCLRPGCRGRAQPRASPRLRPDARRPRDDIACAAGSARSAGRI
uniref:LLM class flavin-dependent oxidoreductase n=1 Tax=Mangrovicoccus ximenensis TaxID=1911570 RepID=UPI00191C08DD|nr:LLM class flavin-dependent oxidoreductase [Mangrovicoccus ximenensis]